MLLVAFLKLLIKDLEKEFKNYLWLQLAKITITLQDSNNFSQKVHNSKIWQNRCKFNKIIAVWQQAWESTLLGELVLTVEIQMIRNLKFQENITR